MSDERWHRLRDLFSDVQGMPLVERSALLDRELAGDAELRAELDALLAADATAGGFLAPQAAAPLPSSIGPYRLLEVLGEGGFGVVYLAEQERPIHRRVAVKLIKLGMDTREVIRRFEAERQALALMDHPGIAQVFEAGETETGRPYFAMEYVSGVPITTYCDESRLRIRERLELFLQVCDAVQHAHQKGVIHRDIKPSNVLVALRDGVAAPKVIDFGIVKATTGATPGATLMTREGVIVGTLGYMSPEQAGGAQALDTRSDIYSLGVLLYELLTGAPPFDSKRLRDAALSDAVRVIREEDPPTLAARLTHSAEGVAAVAKLRSTESRHLMRELKGELQWITLRALEKSPDRRYASAAELGADIRRHLVNEPVLAGAPSTVYRLRKYATRHRVGVTAAAVVLAAIVAGGIATGIGFRRAVLAEHVARREAESARRVTDFLVELFVTPTPDRSMGETITARTILDVGARRIQGDTIDDPSVHARLLSTMGSAYAALALHDEGLTLLRDAADATLRAHGPESVEFGKALSRLASQMHLAGKDEDVDSLMERSVDILSRAEAADVNALASAILLKGQRRLDSGRTAEGDSLVRAAIDMLESEARPDTSALVDAYSTKGMSAQNRYAAREQEQAVLHALSLATAFYGERHSSVLRLHRQLATVYARLVEPDSAMGHADTALRLARSMFPDGHPTLASAISGQGDALMGAYKWVQAAAAHEEALAMYRASYGMDHPRVENELYILGVCYEGAERLDLAIERMREAYEFVARFRGADNPTAAARLRLLATFYAKVGENDRADSLFVAAIPHLDPKRPHESAAAYMGLANVRRDLGRFADADSFYRRSEALYDTTQVANLLFFGDCLTQHAYLRSLQGRHADAESMMRTGIETQLRLDSEDSPEMMDGFLRWAALRTRAGNVDGAMEQLRRAIPCGATAKHVARFPELAALRARPDYPVGSFP